MLHLMNILTLVVTRKSLENPFASWNISSHSSFTADWSSPCCSHFPLPYPSWFLAHLFFWAAYIISFIISSSFLPSFSMPDFLPNKTSHLLFHNYTSLISFPRNKPCYYWDLFPLVPPNLLYKLTLTDVGFLKAHLSTFFPHQLRHLIWDID